MAQEIYVAKYPTRYAKEPAFGFLARARMVMSNFKYVVDYRLVKMGLQVLDYFLGHSLRTIT